MTCIWRWFIHPETSISKNRNGSSTLCVFKTHYRYRRAAIAKDPIFMQNQFSYHTGQGTALRVCLKRPHVVRSKQPYDCERVANGCRPAYPEDRRWNGEGPTDG